MHYLTRWLSFLLFPRFYIGGGDGGGAGRNSEAEERRKAELRDRIDRLYGVKSTRTEYRNITPDQETGPEVSTILPADYQPFEVTDDPEAAAARTQMEGEKTKLADATRSYYTDQLGDQYGDAERKTRFKLARQGLLGGSEDIYQQGDVKSDRDLGATRVDEAVRRSISNLQTQREQERLSSIGLVNSGSGDSAVSAAQAGLRNSLNNAESAQKQNLFTDLFSSGINGVAAGNENSQAQLMAAHFRNKVAQFAQPSTTAKITANR